MKNLRTYAMVWWNTTLGLPFSMDAMKAPDWVELYDRPKIYPRYIIPKPAKILLAACDVQFDRLEVSVIAFYKQQSFVITHEVLPGNTTSIDDECWTELDELLAKDWEHESGLNLRIHRLAIDAPTTIPTLLPTTLESASRWCQSPG